MRGKIVKGIAGFYYVHIVESGVYECKAKGVFRKEGQKPLVGDDVEIDILEKTEKTGNIVRIFPRKNALTRPAVANVDQAMVVFAVTKPKPHFNLLDRFLVMMESKGVPAILCFNKKDIADDLRIQELREIYGRCGYPILFSSARKKENIEEIKARCGDQDPIEWAKEYDDEYYTVLSENESKAKLMMDLDRGGKKPRKDIAKWSEVKDYFSYFYPMYYKKDYTLPENIAPSDAEKILTEYLKVYSEEDEKDIWFQKIKELCEPLGFTPNVKEYKQNPEKYKGHVGDVSTVIRIAVTSRTNTPDLCAIMKILGKDETESRIADAINYYKEVK